MKSKWYVNSKKEIMQAGLPFLDSNFKPRKACLILTILRGEDLPSMDAMGKADPYCVVKVGNAEHTTDVKYHTLAPEWNKTFVFEVENIPQAALYFPTSSVNQNNGALAMSEVPLCELLYYIYIDIWDKDTYNRDDYMGRIIIPISTIPMGETKKWYTVGRTPNSPSATGKIEMNINLKMMDDAEHPPRWCVDELLRQDGLKLPDFQLPMMSGDQIISYPGDNEHVEMVMDDVLVEVSGHRGLGRVYLTDFRLVVLCARTGFASSTKTPDLSLWVALNHILSVERGERGKGEDKVIRKTEDGKAAETEAKTLILKCEDFRTIRFTFMKSQPNVHTYLDTKDHTLDEVKQLLKEDLESSTNSLGDRTTSLTSKSDVTLEKHSKAPPAKSSHSKDDITVDGKTKGGCVSRLFHILHKRLKFIVWNANRLVPCKTYVSNSQDLILNGWNFYNAEKEFARQEISSLWKLTRLNEDYSVSSSYPQHLYVPAKVQDDHIREAAAFRSKGRIPVLTWYSKQRNTFIMRCSQPKIGAMGKFSVADENLVHTARDASPSKRLVIFDARSMLAAGGNRLKGKGTEDIVNRYHGLKLLFLNIANIHAMRDSVDKLQQVCEHAQEHKWMSQLESTQWMLHLRSVIKGATLLSHYVTEKNVSVLVHCSDGWDRTPQLCALAQVLLDPHYRTFKGFKDLIVKDWICFGHRFSDRLGDPLAPSQRSPVFLQFIDCVAQVLCQFPDAFEFKVAYLVRIAEHINSGWFGNFLCNSVREQEQSSVNRLTTSLWAHLDAVEGQFLNKAYTFTEETLYPICSVRRLHFWREYYLRFDDVAFSPRAGAWTDADDEDKDVFDDGTNSTNTVVWVADDRARECHDCKQTFTGMRRRHHCRACGQIFCNGCTRHRKKLPSLGYENAERVCDACWLNVSRCEREDEGEDYEIITEETAATIGCLSL